MTHTALRALTWPADRLGAAAAALASHVGLAPAALAAQADLDAACAALSIEAEPVTAAWPEVESALRRIAPALLRLELDGATRYAAVAGRRGGRLVLLTPELARRALPAAALAEALRAPARARAPALPRLAARIAHRVRDAARAQRALADGLLAAERLDLGWVLRPAPGAPLGRHLREQRALPLLAGLVAAHGLFAALWVLSWWLLGEGALSGNFEPGWLAAWVLILASSAPLRLLASWFGGLLAVRAGLVLKRRLLAGAMRLSPDEVRHLGVGQILGAAMEGELVEQMAIAGGFLTLTSAIELLFALAVLALGAGGWPHAALLAAWIAASGVLGWRYLRRRRAWTTARLALTNDMVEGMVGHRTRLVQEARAGWNERADPPLAACHGAAARMDRAAARVHALIPRGGFLLGLIGLAPAFVAGTAGSGALAVGVGGVLLAWQALRDLAEGMDRALGAAVAWGSVGFLWRAAARPAGEAPRDTATAVPAAPQGGPVLDARGIGFRHPGRSEALFAGADLQVRRGERLLLQGPSGAGKSSLAAVLAGLRPPESGVLLAGGLDLASLGRSGWRRRAALVPQSHENHVLAGPLLFNLLMGRGWPATEADIADAARVCERLGLGPLVARMPSGLAQWVGETGWQLSHGERDRVYLARALLQGSELVIVDESLAALDPDTLHCVGAALAAEVPALLVIAHP